ncbi:methionine aminotransferase [Saonia flava]|uniref:Methionine aminotransferase n=1 Tax=Saonia flava TaxID=523696 RepID=A0A846QZE2_9FLAO|nr:methionine aminotransferase [Saonia flava]NJB71563.1 methionine aminotransferase [Saonia flava]
MALNYKTITSKLPNVKTTIFTTVNSLAKKHNAINLSQGFPDFEMDKELIYLVEKAMKGNYNQYAPMQGAFVLREIISEKIEALYGKKYHPETEITITIGATQAIFSTITAFIRPNDEVIVFKPAYDCYEPAIEVNGGIPVFVQLKSKDYKIDWDDLKNKISSKTKMIIVNTPHNPSGTILSEMDVLKLQEILKDTNIIVVSDEAYEHIVFDGKEHQSFSKFNDLASRSFICASFGKTFHATGWKMGYCAAPKELMKEFQKTHQFNVFSAHHPTQIALAEYLKNPKNYLGLSNFFQDKRDFFLEGIKESRFKFSPSAGTYFQLLDYSAISNENDIKFSERLISEYKLACIPISVFNTDDIDNKQLRFCFGKKKKTLKKAMDILNRI